MTAVSVEFGWWGSRRTLKGVHLGNLSFFLTVLDFVKKIYIWKDVIIYVVSIVFSVLFGSC